jgi:hypothetical protein
VKIYFLGYYRENLRNKREQHLQRMGEAGGGTELTDVTPLHIAYAFIGSYIILFISMEQFEINRKNSKTAEIFFCQNSRFFAEI